MKKTIVALSVLLLFSTTIICAINNEQVAKSTTTQTENDSLGGQLLDPVFQPGQVNFKDGAVSLHNFNYHLQLAQICYVSEGASPFVLSDFSDIESVTYGDRTFIPIDKSNVAEVLKTFSDGSMLLLQRQSRVTRVSDTYGPYGTPTKTSVSTVRTLNSMQLTDLHQQLEGMYKEIIKERFFLMKSGKRHEISKLKTLRNIYPSNWKKIKTYANEHKTDLKNKEDLIDLLVFANR